VISFSKKLSHLRKGLVLPNKLIFRTRFGRLTDLYVLVCSFPTQENQKLLSQSLHILRVLKSRKLLLGLCPRALAACIGFNCTQSAAVLPAGHWLECVGACNRRAAKMRPPRGIFELLINAKRAFLRSTRRGLFFIW
jgi:hypothetical protein